MSLTGISQFVLGFALAIGLLFASGVAATRYLLTRVATPPPRPTFPNDPSPAPAAPPAAPAAANPAAAPAPAVSPSPVAQGYAAKVTQPIGLIVRKEASVDSVEVGGVDFNQQVTVLEDSADGGWQKVRVADGIEGWVKAGNTEKMD